MTTNSASARVGNGSEAGFPESRRSIAYSYYVVVVLMLAYMLSFMDRVILALLIEPVRAEFDLSDTQIGLLIGFGFVLLYTAFGLPFGAVADRSNRRNLILFGLLGWSAATSASGFATSFGGLFAARSAVGVGEATLSPAAYSTIADRFSPQRLGFAIAIYAAGVSIGGGVAMAFGGVLVQWAEATSIAIPAVGSLTGWRLAMFAVGLLGLPLALLMVLTVREAPRRTSAKAPSLKELGHHIQQRPVAFGGAFMGFSFAVLATYIPFLWAPALFMRVHDMDAQEVGTVLGAIIGFGGVFGVLCSGTLSDFLSRRGIHDAPVRIVFWAALLQMPILGAAYLVGNATAALALLAFGMMLTTTSSSLQGTAMQILTPPRMRGRMMAIYFLFITLIGMGLGPLAVGLLSDNVFTYTAGLGPSLAVVSTVSLLLCGLILWITRHAIRRTIEEELRIPAPESTTSLSGSDEDFPHR